MARTRLQTAPFSLLYRATRHRILSAGLVRTMLSRLSLEQASRPTTSSNVPKVNMRIIVPKCILTVVSYLQHPELGVCDVVPLRQFKVRFPTYSSLQALLCIAATGQHRSVSRPPNPLADPSASAEASSPSVPTLVTWDCTKTVCHLVRILETHDSDELPQLTDRLIFCSQVTVTRTSRSQDSTTTTTTCHPWCPPRTV
jgi:hypothetical protein